MGDGRSRCGAWTSSSAAGPSLEAQVAAISDDIAYDNHDIDDGLRAGLLDLDELSELPLVKRAVGRDRRAPSRPLDREAPARAGSRHDRAHGRRRAGARPSGASPMPPCRTIDEVRAAGGPLAGFSDVARRRGTRAQVASSTPGSTTFPSSSPLRIGGRAHRRQSRRGLSRRSFAACRSTGNTAATRCSSCGRSAISSRA